MDDSVVDGLVDVVRQLQDAQWSRSVSEQEMRNLREELNAVGVARMRQQFLEARNRYHGELDVLAELLSRLRSPRFAHSLDATERAITDQIHQVTSARLQKVAAHQLALRARERREILEEMLALQSARLEQEKLVEREALSRCHLPMVEFAKIVFRSTS